MRSIDVTGPRRPRRENGTGCTASGSTSGSNVIWMDGRRGAEQWLEHLRPGHPRRDRTVAELHAALLRVAFHELGRRHGQLRSISGPEFDDLAQQAADDALMKILARLDDFRGLSRFTTWAYAFVVFEVSAKVARHAWRRQPPSRHEPACERVPDSLAVVPGDRLEQQEQLKALAVAIGELTERQEPTHRSSTTSSWGREQQISALPSAGGSTGSGL